MDCPSNSWYNEDGALEVETGFCNYLSVAQTTKTAIAEGDTLRIVLWHGNLRFDAPATGHVGIAVDGNVVWEETVDIPSKANIFDVRTTANFSAPAGSRIEYQVGNHGYNTWTLLEVEVER